MFEIIVGALIMLTGIVIGAAIADNFNSKNE